MKVKKNKLIINEAGNQTLERGKFRTNLEAGKRT